MKGAMVVAPGTKSGTLYTPAGCIHMAAVAEGASGSCLWHNRLGHMSTKGNEDAGCKRSIRRSEVC